MPSDPRFAGPAVLALQLTVSAKLASSHRLPAAILAQETL
jgi:hypothetical protein